MNNALQVIFVWLLRSMSSPIMKPKWDLSREKIEKIIEVFMLRDMEVNKISI